jgi:putative membrane protein
MHGDSWWMWTLMLAGTVGFWVLVALTIQMLFTERRTHTPGPDAPGARQVLDVRLARGEIDPAEYGRVRDLIEHP